MATTFQIVYGGTTIDLNAGNNSLIEYRPTAGDGVNPVTESAVVLISESSIANLQAAVNAIELTNTQAQRRANISAGDRVFLVYQPNGAAAAYRSQILGLKIDLDSDPLWGMPSGFANKKIKVIIALTRVGYFEANSETQLPLTNANGTQVTTALAVYNHDDAGATDDNWVTIDAANAAGVIPCPIRLEITNTYGTAARRIYIGHKAQGTPASFVHILEAESATLNATYVTAGADATCSNGNKAAVVNVPATVATLFTWAVSATQAGYIKGQWVRPILRFSVLPNNSTCRVRVTIKDTTTLAIIYQTEYTTLSTADYLQTLPEIYLSPELTGQTTSGGLSVLLEAKDSAATCDWTLDFLQLTPIEGGTSFAFLRPIDESLVTIPATTGLITYNPIDGATYIESRQGIYQAFGGPLMCYPAVAQRLYFLVDGASDAAIARAITVKAFIRPRKLTV